MNILRNSRSGQSNYCVGKAYGIAAGGCCSHIAFVVNNQALTLVGTRCANVIAASWHGAREEEIKEFKKMKMKNITKWLAVLGVFGLLSLATERADAVLEMSYTADSDNLLGTVIPGQLSGGQAARDAAMTNFLLGMSSQTQTTDNGSLYSRTTLAGGDPATTVGAVALTGYSGGTGNVTIDLSQYGTFQYLVAAYDGQNGGVAVFDISGLTGNVTVYGFAK